MVIHFLDSSVFCNILDIDGKSSCHAETLEELTKISSSTNEKIILPFATIIETGNHVAHIKDGNLRYKTANKFNDAIIKTIENIAPWSYYGSQLSEDDLKVICSKFPEVVKDKMGIGDLSIVRAYEKYKEETPGIHEIRIWSYDKHLMSYHEIMELPERRRR